MPTARWFFEPEVNSKFVLQEHLRQDFWRSGPSTLWVDAVQTTPPYKAVGYWHDLTFEIEWVPRDYVILRANRADKEILRATTLQLGFKPARQGEEGGQYVTEWRLRPAGAPPGEMMETRIGATPVIENGE